MSLTIISNIHHIQWTSLRRALTCNVRNFNFSPPNTRQDEYSDQLWDQTVISKTRNQLFDDEVRRQRTLIPRVEKIEVDLYNVKPHENVTLLMNKNLSTPYECAQHLSELYLNRSVIAMVDEKNLWDMHRPLVDNCKLTFKHFKDENPGEVNKAFWRSCSFMLGMVSSRTI